MPAFGLSTRVTVGLCAHTIRRQAVRLYQFRGTSECAVHPACVCSALACLCSLPLYASLLHAVHVLHSCSVTISSTCCMRCVSSTQQQRSCRCSAACVHCCTNTSSLEVLVAACGHVGRCCMDHCHVPVAASTHGMSPQRRTEDIEDIEAGVLQRRCSHRVPAAGPGVGAATEATLCLGSQGQTMAWLMSLPCCRCCALQADAAIRHPCFLEALTCSRTSISGTATMACHSSCVVSG
jgi:hypothetical protein